MENELTATEENVVNQRSDTMTLAINKVMGQDEQSYDDFMNGFQHITKEGVMKSRKQIITESNSSKEGTKQFIRNKSAPHQVITNENQGPVRKELIEEEEDELEEELLDSGTKATEITMGDNSSRVKFGNFVDEDMSDDEPSGYIASFGKESEDTDSPNGTDSLLLNGTDNHSLKSTDKKSLNCTDKTSPNGTDNYETKQKESVQTDESKDHSEQPDLCSEIVIEKEPKTNLKSNGDNESESSNDHEQSEMQCVEVGSGNGHMTLYPGEADSESVVTGREKANHTHLKFAVVKCQSCDTKEQMSLEPTDEVKPFSLDDDFDYDNVTLTPKFTVQEVEHLKSFLPHNQVES